MSKVSAYAATAADAVLGPLSIERRAPGPHDVQIDILYCGICHSDIHQVRNEWGNSIYPMVPGHEIVGRISAVGEHVKNFKVGELAGVGCIVDSCRTCSQCEAGEEQYCETGLIGTYNSLDKNGQPTYGGFFSPKVVEVKHTPHISQNLDLPGAAPLF